MLTEDQLIEELYESFKIGMGAVGKGEVTLFSDLSKDSVSLLRVQVRYLSEKFYFFRKTTGDRILTIMQEELEHWEKKP